MNSKITALQLISLMLMSSVMLVGCKRYHPNYSGPITSTDADLLIKTYNSSNSILRTYDQIGLRKKLVHFRFNAPDIDEIINHNASNVTPVDQVVFYLGLEKAPKRWHLIAYGMNPPYNVTPNTGGKLLDYSNVAGHDASIFDSEGALTTPKKDPAATRRQNYKDNVPLRTFDNHDKPLDQLYGFAFTASQINRLLGERPDRIALDIGLDFVGGDQSKIRWHLIAYGMKNNSPIGTQAVSSKAVLPPNGLYVDQADPCPPCTP